MAVPDAAATSLSRWAPSLECCHKECLGGCWGPEAHQCYLCRNAMYNQSCVATCPRDLVRIHMSRCITEQQCQYVPSTAPDTVGFEPKPWRVFNGTCVPFCPQGYEEHTQEGRLTCRVCDQGGCKIICTSNKVDTIAKAQLLEGCTHINTSLEIQINGGKDVSQELEAYLGAIEEIDNFLKITRSFSILNLNFLKSLRVIHGKQLEKGKYSLVVLDNPNLQDLWDWESRDSALTLENGSIFFHLNPKLCPREIRRLQDVTRLPAGSFSEQDVSNVTNGDEVECIVVDLKARVTTKLVTGVLSVPKHSSLLSYLVYSIEAPFQNVSAYDGLDVCGGNDWRVDDVASATSYEDEGVSADGDPRKVYQILTRLNPNTQYAFYIRTYSLTTASHYGGQSPIQYFTTLPSRPSPPVNLRALSSQHSELVVQWEPPVNFNGNLSHYLVVGQWIPDDHQFLLEQRDYCQHPMIRESASESVSKQVSQPCGQHGHLGQHTHAQHTHVQQQQQQQPDECPARCGGLSSEMFPQDEALDPERKNESRDPAASRNFTVGGVLHEFSYTIPAHLNNVTARPLRHFGLYSIQVWACRHPHPEEPFNAERCSSATQISVRTTPKTNLDQVTSVNATVIGPSEVKLYWIPPAKPNGLVLAFHIEYRREGQRNFQPYEQCLSVNPHVTPEEETYKLDNLLAGTYSVKIRTISLAGEGPYSEKATFVLHSSVDSDKTGSVKKSILITLASFIPIIGSVLQQILSGCCLTPPNDCPEILSTMMQACWQRSPLARPTFVNLLERLLPLIPAEFAQVSFYHGNCSIETSSTQQSRPILAPTSNGVAMHFSSP
ncbi:hypothetical protein B566_EDAN005513 [Ephemera danica]|nr:hypothetical protein B566_EDAN005513 [Ephemera danica]